MWISLLDVYLTGMAMVVVLNINHLACMGFPVDQSETNKKEDAEDEKNQDTKAETADSGSTTPCWETENFTLVGSCTPCQPLPSKILDSCYETGFNQLVHCTESDEKVYKSCPRSRESIERTFWAFQGVMLIMGIFSCLVVFVRRRKLNHEAAERVRKQISNSV